MSEAEPPGRTGGRSAARRPLRRRLLRRGHRFCLAGRCRRSCGWRRWPGGLAQRPVDRGSAHPQHRADLLDRQLPRVVHPADLPDLLGGQLRRPAPDPPPCPPRGQPGHRPVPDDLPLELRQRPEQMEHQPPPSGRGGDALPQRPKPHLTLVQSSHHLDQVPQRPAQPVQPPHHQGVPRPQLPQHRLQLRPPVQHPRRMIGPDLPAAGSGQLVDLQVRVLLGRRDPRVAQRVRHAQPVPQTPFTTDSRYVGSGQLLRTRPLPDSTLTSGPPPQVDRRHEPDGPTNKRSYARLGQRRRAVGAPALSCR